MEIPQEVHSIISALQNAGHQAFIVGGCVRDLLRGEKPKDWDVTTSAKPEEILKLFSRRPILEVGKEVGTPTPDVGAGAFYENKFLTVTVRTESKDQTLQEIEITTFRAEGKYTDKRHPDSVRFAETLEEDLSRRDFTINAIAMALDLSLVDPHEGQKDLEKKLIRAVGDPEKRFEEDALRMIRAVRFAVELSAQGGPVSGWEIEEKTREAILHNAGSLTFIAKERIRDEFIKILGTPQAKEGVELLHELGLLKHFLSEVEEGIGVENRPKIFTIWEHNLKALEYGAKSKFPLDVRIAALLHDVGKPATKGPMKNNEWTFYGHDVVGAKMATAILGRLHFPHAAIEKIAKLIRWHLFKYDPDEGITDSSVRRLIRHVGAENMEDLVKVRICDRMGMGVPKAVPYRLRHFQFRVEKILREEEAPTPKMLKVNGEDVMRILEISPGPKVGHVLEVLLQEVIDEPTKNTKEKLEARIQELGKLSDEELVKIAEVAETKVEMTEDERISGIKAKYYVK
ncbi:MAG: HD domain-containing protein [Candidatus Sungiibacteriota bacterium]|uniref:HD domain-containing protein n=1 Tax=Candidatus Sungiibacteriota bacterium TaxID=2750080 RepID=A0A7T5URM9_9BACT|nr:MAG: HD domain-containing protein [Candidatus Sungbacteria bacterium]